MCRLKRYILVIALAACWGGAAPANPSLVQVFAGCAGRFSAEMEHAWLMGAPEARAIEAHRLRFLSLLAAIMPPQAARQMLSYRIEVKLAHAALLTLATFGENSQRAGQAARLARQHVTSCQSMLLDS